MIKFRDIIATEEKNPWFKKQVDAAGTFDVRPYPTYRFDWLLSVSKNGNETNQLPLIDSDGGPGKV